MITLRLFEKQGLKEYCRTG